MSDLRSGSLRFKRRRGLVLGPLSDLIQRLNERAKKRPAKKRHLRTVPS